MNIKLSDRLRIARNNKGMSQKDLALAVDVSVQTINKYERGHRIPDANVIVRLLDIFGCDANWLLIGKESASPDPMMTWPEDVRDACLKAKEIIESKDPVITPVLMSNIAAFYDAIKQKEDNRGLAKKVDDLQKEVEYIKKISKPGSRTGTD